MDKQIYEAIQLIISIAKLGSLSLVNEQTGIDPKTIRQKIKKLEQETNRALILSNNQGTQLTKHGWEFYYDVIKKYSEFDDHILNVISNNTVRKERLKIMCPPLPALYFTQKIMPHMVKIYPGLLIEINTFNIEYIIANGSHVKNIFNNYDLLYLDQLAMKLIDIDAWLKVYESSQYLKLYANPNYIDHNHIERLDDLSKLTFILKPYSREDTKTLILLENDIEKVIPLRNTLYAENDLVKAHMANQGLGIALLSDTVFQTNQQLDLKQVFPDFHSKFADQYSMLVKVNNPMKKYIEEIVSAARKSS